MLIFRISRPDDDLVVDVDSIDRVKGIVESGNQGRYHVDEHAADSLPGSKSSARAWGTVIHQKDGQVVRDPNPWPTY
jgi:hypothetical protein